MQGVLMASVDRVGRQFPITLAAPVAGHLALNHLAAAKQFRSLEDIALTALEDDTTKDALTERLAAHPPWAPVKPPPPAARTIIANGTGLAANLAAQSSHLATAQSLWSTVLEGEERLVICAGLPNAQELHALFDFDAPHWTSP